MYDLNDLKLPPSFDDDMHNKPNYYKLIKDTYDILTKEEHLEAMRHYLAFCSYEDMLFGKVIDALKEIGEYDNTVVIYLSDHGDYMAEHGLWTKGLPNFNAAYHIPLAIRWPKGIRNPNRVVDDFVSITDLAPTILEMADIEADRKLMGKSLMPFLKDEKVINFREAIYTQTNGNELYSIQRAVMTKDWKFVYNGFDYSELYHLKDDPHEMNNLIKKDEYQDIVRELSKKLWKFAYETDDVCINSYVMNRFAPFGPGVAFEDEMIEKGDINE